jgi:hypothetical protein
MMGDMDGDRLLSLWPTHGRLTFLGNIEDLTLDEALGAAGGYRSVLGIVKHTAAWSAVYHSAAFDAEPLGWNEIDWPRGLRETIEPTQEYLEGIVAWFEATYERWQTSLFEADDLDAPRSFHGARTTITGLVIQTGAHWTYHAGEINSILAIQRGEAWELGEEIEENHISSAEHAVRPDWMSDEEADRLRGRRW